MSARLAPRPAPGVRATAPFIVVGHLRTASGLGEGARLCHDALAQCGHTVYGIDFTDRFQQPGPKVDFAFIDGQALTGPGTLILHINSPFLPLALMSLGKRLIKGKRLIGYWAWELPSVPQEWRFGIPFVHEIWVPSWFTAGAITPIAGETPLRVVPHPVAVSRVPANPASRPNQRPFTVLSAVNMASSFARKNPVAGVQAFKEAFGNDSACRLLIRVSNANVYPEGYEALMSAIASAPNIQLSEATANRGELGYQTADVVLSLHRSEGFGLVIAEAMLHGLPVVATDWSGNVDFLTPENGLPVSYSLVPAVDPQGTYHHPSLVWADANIEDAAAKLRMMRNDPAMRAALGKRAASDVATALGVEAYRKIVEGALRQPS